VTTKDFIDLKPIQVTTPEDTRLTYSWLVNPDDKFPPARWQVTAVIPNSPAAVELGEKLDTFFLDFKKALKATYPDKQKDDYKWNPLPYEWADHQELGLKNALILKCNKKTQSPDGRPKTPPIIFDDSNNGMPLNDEQKQKYDKIGPGTTAQIALYVSQYNLGVGTGIRLTPAAVNIKNFIPFGSQANSAQDWGFTVDNEPTKKHDATPSSRNTDDFDF
tara:strand:+ start:3302 stop:3958 length:657 start_codon:yes stop_codon:yes gene_type:complete